MSEEEITQRLSQMGIKLTDNAENDFNELKEICFLFYDDKEYDKILENKTAIDDYLNGPEGFETRQMFVKNTADRFNLEFETNMQ